jgi:hypothetical protein
VVCFFKFLTPITLGDRNFLIFNPFLTIVSVSDVPRGGVQVLLDTRNNGTLPLDPAFLKPLNVRSLASLPYSPVFSYQNIHIEYQFLTHFVPKVKWDVNSVDIHPQLSHNRHLVDGLLLGSPFGSPRTSHSPCRLVTKQSVV